jgi:hypothetical protein
MSMIEEALKLERRLTPALPVPAEDWDACLDRLRAETARRNRAEGRGYCKCCGSMINPREDGQELLLDWCCTCAMIFIDERIIRPLTRSLGHRAARKALLALVRRSRSRRRSK